MSQDANATETDAAARRFAQDNLNLREHIQDLDDALRRAEQDRTALETRLHTQTELLAATRAHLEDTRKQRDWAMATLESAFRPRIMQGPQTMTNAEAQAAYPAAKPDAWDSGH